MAAGGKTFLAAAGTLAVLATASAHDRVTTKVTWEREVAPIVQARCVRCHQPGGRAPMPLGTYAEAKPWARAIKEQVLLRRMPKWHAARGYGDLANDPSLSSFEIALIASWVDGGAPEKTATANPGQPASVAVATPEEAPLPRRARTLALPCGDSSPLLEGRLLAVQPTLEKGGSAGISVRWPDGRREIVAWVRNYEPEFPETYWLRRPLTLTRGSRLEVESTAPCSIAATVADR